MTSSFVREKITTDLVTAPLTALEVVQSYILSGEASYLHVYNLTSGEHLNQVCILGPYVIHGIRKGENDLWAVFGQKAVSVIRIELEGQVRLQVLCDTAEFPDWILDVAFLSHDESSSSVGYLGLILAHNSIMLWDWECRVCLQHAHSAENCILYSARILGNSWNTLTVAAGTVFNQIVLWKPAPPKDTDGRVLVQRRLSGHQGVIFNLSYHERRKLLCSVSDDRSIRLWPLDFENIPMEHSDAAQTVMYGHSARVWDAKILDHTIVSVGEDATCCVWNSSGDILHRFTGHQGQSIWSLAVNENQKLIVTGGGDCSIRIWSVATKQEGRTCITTDELHIQMGLETILLNSGILAPSQSCPGSEMTIDSEGFVPRQLAVLNSGKIVVMTSNGCLLCYVLESRQWQLQSHDPRYQSYSLLSVCPSHKVAALGNIQGRVKILDPGTGQSLVEMSVFTGKIFSFCWANEEDLFITGPEGLVIWSKLSKSTDGYCLEEEAKLLLPEAPQRWATAIALVPHQEGALVCGDRRGSVLLYTQLHHASKQPSGPTHALSYIHGKAGVTHVCLHAAFVYSTGRDGTYRQYRLQGTRLQILNTFKVYKGFTWIERISFTAADDVLVSGFHASSFIIWSRERNESLVKIECGGGHRAWGFTTCQAVKTTGENSPTQGRDSTTGATVGGIDGTCGTLAVFACIKAKKVIVCTAPDERLQQHSILKESLHGRRVSCIKHLATVSLPEGECAVCATGSEDNTINIAAVVFSQCKPSTLHVLHRLSVHISSVRCLASCPSSYTHDCMESRDREEASERTGHRLLLFSVGGRRAIQCWRVTIPKQCPRQDRVDEWLKSVCTVEHLASYGNTDNVKQRRWLKKHGQPVDPETRFMSVCVWTGSQLIHRKKVHCFLGVTGSDACVRLFAFCEETKELFPILTSDWHNCCLLTTLSIVHRCPWGPCPILLTAGTSGNIAFWDIQKAIRKCDSSAEKGKQLQSSIAEEEERVTEKLDQQTDAVSKGSCSSAVHRNDVVSSHARLPSQRLATHKKHEEIRTAGSHWNTERTAQDPDQQGYLSLSDPISSPVPSVDQEEVFHQRERDASWDMEGNIGRLLLSVDAHQSGVNALCVSQLDGSRYLLASGGDDNSIQLALLDVSCDEGDRHISVNLKHTHTITCAHAAQVTGLCFLGACTLVSSSIDQRLNLWNIELSPDKALVNKVEQIFSKFILVADCADMASWTARCGWHCISVCGQGVQVLHLKDESRGSGVAGSSAAFPHFSGNSL